MIAHVLCVSPCMLPLTSENVSAWPFLGRTRLGLGRLWPNSVLDCDQIRPRLTESDPPISAVSFGRLRPQSFGQRRPMLGSICLSVNLGPESNNVGQARPRIWPPSRPCSLHRLGQSWATSTALLWGPTRPIFRQMLGSISANYGPDSTKLGRCLMVLAELGQTSSRLSFRVKPAAHLPEAPAFSADARACACACASACALLVLCVCV